MNEAEFKIGDYIFHSSFGVGKLIRPAERDGKPGFELDFKDRSGHFMSLDILRRAQPTHPDSLRVFAFEHKVEAVRLMQDDPAGIVIRALGQSQAPLERPDIERILIESTLVSGPEQFKTWWGKALPKLKNSPWLDITLHGSRVLVRRLESPRSVPVPPPPTSTLSSLRETPPPRPAATAQQPRPSVSPKPPVAPASRPAAPAKPTVSVSDPKPATNNNGSATLAFDIADFHRQLRLIEQNGATLTDEAREYLSQVATRPNVPITIQFEALLTAYRKGGLSKAELLERIAEKAQSGIGLEQLEEAGVRSDIALLILEEEQLPPEVLRWLSGSFISDLTLAELVLDRLVELRQFDILGQSIEKVTTGLEFDPTRLGRELDFVRWMGQKEPDLAALAITHGYPWPPASLTARIIQVLIALIEMDLRDERSREIRKDGLIEVARLLETRSVERDPATVTRSVQAINAARPKNEQLVEAFSLLLGQPDRPLVPRLLKYVELNLSTLEDSALVSAVLQLEIGRAESADFGLAHWWLGQAVRLKSLRLARTIFEFVQLRLNRAMDENEQLRCILFLMQMVDLELINQNQAMPVRTALAQFFQKIAAQKIKASSENGVLLNEMIDTLNEMLERIQRLLNQTIMEKEGAEEELRSLKGAK